MELLRDKKLCTYCHKPFVSVAAHKTLRGPAGEALCPNTAANFNVCSCPACTEFKAQPK